MQRIAPGAIITVGSTERETAMAKRTSPSWRKPFASTERPDDAMVERALAQIYVSFKEEPPLTKELTQAAMSVLRECSKDELEALASPITGIASRVSWPPKLKDFADFRKEWREKTLDRLDFERRHPVREALTGVLAE